ncbi:S-methyl-5-thioribose-1-phosphate isomerase [Mediannikoviicoccus vaginalis]|uniref:S-methyl-5-thioribose-1-phosphate isomerase n=1 Tax=Mediannikoviicoccus vaginalis TaxID=2899727 RepID=UPI001F1FC16E|nr:S-methyl-5-thioribose-1-phosphate isomerase [Mediannikoviicoccus vaginalis]
MKRQDYDMAFMLQYENVAWYEDGRVRILDRRVYPVEVSFVYCNSYVDVAKAIKDMVTQSAGPYTACGMGMALAAYECRNKSEEKQLEFMKEAAHALTYARPTTSNRMGKVCSNSLKVFEEALAEGVDADKAIFDLTIESLNRRYSTMTVVGKYLVSLMERDFNVMTQCFGETIVGTMLREAREIGLNLHLWVPETRPYFQGSRLTASVCHDMGFDTTVITDNMVSQVLKEKDINIFTSAADSITMDGYVVNKIGTYQIAISSKYHHVPYFVTGIPDIDKKSIDEVKIEYRDDREVLEARGVRNAMEGVKGYYPSFDITPPHLVSGVVTDKGIYTPYNLKEYCESEVKEFY